MPKSIMISAKKIYILFLCVLPLILFSIKTTYSKFTQTITTEKEIVNLNTSLTLNISNVSEYKTLTIGSNDYDIFDIEVSNNTDKKVFYSFWYKLINQEENDNIIVAKLNTSKNPTQGELEVYETKTISFIIKNNTNHQIKLNIGLSTSNTNIQDIKYQDNKKSILKEDSETNIYYDRITDKYYFSKTSTEVEFKIEPTTYSYSNDYQTFTAPYSGYYQVGLWGPSTTTKSGDYISSSIYLKKGTSIYFYVGRNRASNIFAETDVRLIPGSWTNERSINSRLLIAGNDINSSYIYGYNPKEEKTESENTYQLNTDITYDLKMPEYSLITSNTNQGDGLATIQFINNQEPSIEGIKYVKLGQNYNLEDITCKDNGRGCNLIKVRPETTENLSIGTYEIVYIVTDNDNITYKYTETFEVISE